jgi:hypothetical protein
MVLAGKQAYGNYIGSVHFGRLVSDMPTYPANLCPFYGDVAVVW